MFSQIPGTFRCSTWLWLHLHLAAQLSALLAAAAGNFLSRTRTFPRWEYGCGTGCMHCSLAPCTAPLHHAPAFKPALQRALRGAPRVPQQHGTPHRGGATTIVPSPRHRCLLAAASPAGAARHPADRNRRLALRRRKSPAVFNQHFPWSCWKPFRSAALFLLIYVALLLGG